MLPSISLYRENVLIEYFEEAYVMTCLTILKIIKANTINPHRNPMNCVIPLCPVV